MEIHACQAQTAAYLQKIRPALLALADEYSRAALQTVSAARAVGGGGARSRTEIFSQLHKPPRAWSEVRARVARNILYFRASYAQALAVWWLICAARNPARMVVLLCVGVLWFHATVVRRGVVHFPRPGGGVHTLMGQRLLAALGGVSLLLLLLLGGLGLVLLLAVAPCVLALHAAARSPPLTSEWQPLAAELRLAVHAAFHDDKESEPDELEGGLRDAAPAPPPLRDPDVARRVEQIRQKYRPPTQGDKKAD